MYSERKTWDCSQTLIHGFSCCLTMVTLLEHEGKVLYISLLSLKITFLKNI